MNKKDLMVKEIRNYNRFYTDFLGILDQKILDSQYSLTEARILYEINVIKNCNAKKIMDIINIDRGYMSRIIKNLINEGIVRKLNSPSDKRVDHLYLTEKGKQVLLDLENKSNEQVKKLLDNLSESEIEKLTDSMKYIKNMIQKSLNPVVIRDFKNSDIDYLIELHKKIYEKEYGFSGTFGDYVEKYMKKFAEKCNKDKENMWIAELNGKIVGAVTAVHKDDFTAQLRWFLMDPEVRGRGMGHKLLETLFDFCKDKEYKHIFLWTSNILEAARHLYKSYGFVITETKENNEWGKTILEERWDLDIVALDSINN